MYITMENCLKGILIILFKSFLQIFLFLNHWKILRGLLMNVDMFTLWTSESNVNGSMTVSILEFFVFSIFAWKSE